MDINFLNWLAYTVEHFPDVPLPLTARQLSQVMALDTAAQGGKLKWTDISGAHQLTGIAPRTLRSRATRWAEMIAKGQRPDIRVRKKSDKGGAPWEFCEADCRAYGEANPSAPPKPAAEGSDPVLETLEPQLTPAEEDTYAITEDIEEYIKRAANR